jgi:hypothetical protein
MLGEFYPNGRITTTVTTDGNGQQTVVLPLLSVVAVPVIRPEPSRKVQPMPDSRARCPAAVLWKSLPVRLDLGGEVGRLGWVAFQEGQDAGGGLSG